MLTELEKANARTAAFRAEKGEACTLLRSRLEEGIGHEDADRAIETVSLLRFLDRLEDELR